MKKMRRMCSQIFFWDDRTSSHLSVPALVSDTVFLWKLVSSLRLVSFVDLIVQYYLSRSLIQLSGLFSNILQSHTSDASSASFLRYPHQCQSSVSLLWFLYQARACTEFVQVSQTIKLPMMVFSSQCHFSDIISASFSKARFCKILAVSLSSHTHFQECTSVSFGLLVSTFLRMIPVMR